MNEHRKPTPDELALWALGALEPGDAERVERAVADDATLADESARMRAHLDLYDAMADAPPPPSFSRVERALRRSRPDAVVPVQRHAVPIWAMAAAAVLLAGVGLLFALKERGSDPTPTPPTTILIGDGWQMTKTQHGLDYRAADAAAELRWQSEGRGIHLIADRGTTVRLDPDAAHVRLLAGRAWFEVEPARTLGAEDFRVSIEAHTVRVVGTVFTVDAARRQVAVVRGRVEVDGTAVDHGHAWTQGAVAPRPGGAVSWLPRPTLTLAQNQERAGPIFALTLRNESAVTVYLPAPAGDRSGLWMEWLDKDGQRLQSLPIRPQALEGDSAWLRGDRPVALAPRGERTLWIRFRAAERPAGAYRCRALVRPAGAPPILSNPLGLEDR